MLRRDRGQSEALPARRRSGWLIQGRTADGQATDRVEMPLLSYASWNERPCAFCFPADTQDQPTALFLDDDFD
jgi:hypothetical protein